MKRIISKMKDSDKPKHSKDLRALADREQVNISEVK